MAAGSAAAQTLRPKATPAAPAAIASAASASEREGSRGSPPASTTGMPQPIPSAIAEAGCGKDVLTTCAPSSAAVRQQAAIASGSCPAGMISQTYARPAASAAAAARPASCSAASSNGVPTCTNVSTAPAPRRTRVLDRPGSRVLGRAVAVERERGEIELEDRHGARERLAAVAQRAVGHDHRVGSCRDHRSQKRLAVLEPVARPGIERVVDRDDDGAAVGGQRRRHSVSAPKSL